jgi:predicted Zn-dependent protease
MTSVAGESLAAASLQTGLALLNAGNPRGACGYFHTALATEPTNAGALRGLVSARLALNELVEAQEAVDQLVRIAPTQFSTHELKSRVYLHNRALPSAVVAAEEMIRAAPNNAMGFHLLAAARIAQKRYREALNATQEGRRLAPKWAILMAQAGWAKLELRGPPAAKSDIEEALRLAPKDRYIRYVAAVLATACGHTREARALCESILRENVNDKNALDLYVLTEGPFPAHWWAIRWRYFCKSAGPFAVLVRAAGWAAYLFLWIALCVATVGIACVFGFALRFWIAHEKDERKKRVIQHFSAPVVRN